MNNVLETDEVDVQLRFPWEVTCGIAVKAFLLGITFSEAIRWALERHLINERPKDEPRKHKRK